MIRVAMLDNLITVFEKMTGLVHEGQGVDIPCVDLSKAFDTYGRSSYDKLMKNGMDGGDSEVN